MSSLRSVACAAAAFTALSVSACGSSLDISHTETPCITTGQPVMITITAPAGTHLDFTVQDDFGGTIPPPIAPQTTDASGKATITWQSPSQLSTTTLHFILNATHGSDHATRDIHVVVGGNGRSC